MVHVRRQLTERSVFSSDAGAGLLRHPRDAGRLQGVGGGGQHRAAHGDPAAEARKTPPTTLHVFGYRLLRE